MASPVTFGEWLRGQRAERKLTRDEFAQRVGCSVALLRKIEDGERRPSAQIAELIANGLNLPATDRGTFVKVARGELNVERLAPLSAPRTNPASPASAPAWRNNLPVLATPLVGRQREVDELSQLLRDPQCRLLTLIGPGGIGKTRLAIETAARLQDAFADGVYFVPLAPVSTSRFIVPVIADAIGFTFQATSLADPKAQLSNYLREKQVLLLVDNLEHLLNETGIEVLAELLASAPQVKILATSRESLGLQGEWVFEVQGLPIPAAEQAERGAQHTSVELFLQRARRAHVGFGAAAEDYPVIVQICHLVDGMPLGIELAAAWVRTLSCDAIAHEIKRGLDFLSVSTRDLPARHRSMRAVFDHSWQLLTEQEREVLLRLSMFQGGFGREAAEQVAGALLSVLSALVTKSLIRRSGSERYDLHELIRQFAGEQFARQPEEQAAARARHSRYYLTYFGQADSRLRSPAQLQALAELAPELDNFRAAWDWAVIHGEFALIEQTMRLFWMLYDAHGWFQEGLDALGRAIDALETARGHSPQDRTDQVALGHVLAVRGWLAYRLARYGQAQSMLERSVEILRPVNEPRVMVESLTYLGMLMEMTGNYARALELYSEGLETATGIGDRWFRDLCLTCYNGVIANTRVTATVKPEQAHAGLRAVVADWRLIGDPRLIGFGLRVLSQSAFALGRYDESRAALEESVVLNRSIGFGWGLGAAYRGLGIVAQAQGEHEQAVITFRKSLDTFTELGGSGWVARVLAEMGRSILALGDEAKAGRIWGESLRIAAEIRGVPVVLAALVGIASLRVKRGETQSALELLLIVLSHPACDQETKNRGSVLRAELETQLTIQQAQAARERAQTKTLERLVDEILKQA